MIGAGFTLIHMSDSKHFYPDVNADPGTWDHFVAFAPPFFAYWLRYQPPIA